LLVKRNWDTLRAVKEIARHLGINEDRIQIAGIKDAKAVTAQHITVSRFLPHQVSGLQLKDIVLHPLRFSNQGIFPGLLLGNQFCIIVRALFHRSSAIEQRVKNVESELSNQGGFPNFFGHQRFGTVRPITHLVGKLLLRGSLEGAALAFLAQSSSREHPESREARERLWDTQDFKGALRHFPRNLYYERLMLGHLAKQSGDFAGAFRRLPLKLRKLFVQAYESFLFNKFLSQRMRRGIPINETQIGDYVVKFDEHELPTTDFMQVSASSLQTVKEALNEGKMRVAIPLVGFKQPPSQGVQGEIEQEILETENMNPQAFHISFMPEVSASGVLRAILALAINLSVEEVSRDSANPSKRKTRLGFTLHRGSYATVLLREFMKPRDLIKAGY